MRELIGTHDVLMVTLDTLRYDVAAELAAAGRTPHLAAVLPGGGWERRHSPASFTYAAHHAFFAGFLPTPAKPATPDTARTSGTPATHGTPRTPGNAGTPGTPGTHDRLFAAAFPGSETSGPGTWVFDAPDLPTALAKEGYHTLCLGGVGFFNRRTALGEVLPALFTEAHWEPSFGVTEPDCLGAQLARLESSLTAVPAGQPVFTFLNVAAMHQPNRHYAGLAEDTRESHAAALEYVDGLMPQLFELVTGRGRPVFVIMCADHGTAYGEDGHTGHRVGHEVVWTVPYAQFTLAAS
jgi:Sulfatase